jgi:hypothetical protein
MAGCVTDCGTTSYKILGKWPTWRTVLSYVFIFIFNSLHVSSTSCSSSGEMNCVNTTSGSCHSVLVAVSCAGWEWTHFTPNLIEIGGSIEGMGRRRRGRKQLLSILQDKEGSWGNARSRSLRNSRWKTIVLSQDRKRNEWMSEWISNRRMDECGSLVGDTESGKRKY